MTDTTCGWDAKTQSTYEHPLTPEELTQREVDRVASAKAAVLAQIAALEVQQTERLVREAVLGGDYAIEKLAQIEAEISALREKL